MKVVLNDRVKLALAMVNKGYIKFGDDHYKKIIDFTKSSDRYIIEKAKYYKVQIGGTNG
jgi:hypothetical protein